MNENMPMGPSPEEIARLEKEAEEDARFEAWMNAHPEPETAPEAKREAGPEILMFEEMIAAFEAEHPLDELDAITEFGDENAPTYAVRESARVAFIAVTDAFNRIKKETNVALDELERLNTRRKRISQAIGFVQEGKVNHN